MTLITRSVAFLTLLFLSFNANANTLKISTIAIGETFDVRYTLDANAFFVLKLMSTGLIASTEEDTPAAKLINKSPFSYTFKLKNIKFTNGDELNSTTVKNIYLDLINNKKITVYKPTLENIKSINIIDNKTIKFNFKKIDNFPDAKFTIPLFKRIENKMIGLGPYIIDEFKFPYTLKLKAVDTSLYYQNLEFIPNSMPIVRILKFMKNEVDVLHNDLQAMQINLLKKKGYNVNSTLSSTYVYLGFNHKDKITGSTAVRKAIAYSIDIDSITKNLHLGYTKKAGSLLGKDHKHYKANFFKRDLNKATELLENAGFKANKNGVRLEIDFSITTNNQSLRYAQILQDQLKDAGIKLNIIASDWGRFYKDIKDGNVQMYALAWVGIFDGDIFKELFNSQSIGDGGLNRSFYKNKQMDELTNKAIYEKQSEKQMKSTLFAIQDLQFNDMIYVPLWKKLNVVISRDEIKPYTPTLDGGFESIKNMKKD